MHTTDSAPSRFLTEAGLAPARPYGEPAPKPGRSPERDRRLPNGAGNDPVAAVPREALRVGLAYALRNATSRTTALAAAATAVDNGLLGPDTASTRMTVHELLAAIEAIGDAQRAAVLAATSVAENQTPIARLSKKSRAPIARALRRQALRITPAGAPLAHSAGADEITHQRSSRASPEPNPRVRDPTHAGHAHPPWTTAIRGQFAERARRRKRGGRTGMQNSRSAYAGPVGVDAAAACLDAPRPARATIEMSPKRWPPSTPLGT